MTVEGKEIDLYGTGVIQKRIAGVGDDASAGTDRCPVWD
jgi:hypothetical protein